jgi:hypothetical protein
MDWRGAGISGWALPRGLLSAAGVGLLAVTAFAQSGAPYTLHVNVRLMEVPTLVLSPSLEPLPPVDPKRFRVHLDSGPGFRPKYVRREGNDPIALAILLDLSGSEEDLIAELSRDFSPWIKDSFRPGDRIAIYGLDCKLVHTFGYLPATPAVLQHAIDSVIHSPDVHGPKGYPACGNKLHLWNALAIISNEISNLPGRRVILAVTAGHDRGSSVNLFDIKLMNVDRSVTLFGMARQVSFFNRWRVEQDLSPVCQASGGLLFLTPPSLLPANLRQFVDMLRSRYILQFPEPPNAMAGLHSLNVTIDHTLALVLPAGVTVKLDDATQVHDGTALSREMFR